MLENRERQNLVFRAYASKANRWMFSGVLAKGTNRYGFYWEGRRWATEWK